ncbi:hypothetical protein [Amycolatopsis sp. RTGN1]|uniref:hypothetical protein n=1 Tax=Amycolatopsis ponsaeliensis TaxID=2992142 RepID=UPI00254CB003|nr:hypothetical protein [Amycolatopsis sp. RTGN1]
MTVDDTTGSEARAHMSAGWDGWPHAGTPLHDATEAGGLTGYVYAVEFSNRWIKIGETNNAKRRITNEHCTDAAKFGITITRSWVSPLHHERKVSEEALIAYCEQHGQRTAGRERFAGVDFADLQAHAESLDYRAVPPARAIDDIDLDRMKALAADDKLWTIAQVAEGLGLSLRRTRQLWRQMTDWLQYGQGIWPPRPDTYLTDPHPVQLEWFPPHQTLLPLPDDDATGQPRWRAGTIRMWAMQTGRMNPDGTPKHAKPSGRPRQAPALTGSAAPAPGPRAMSRSSTERAKPGQPRPRQTGQHRTPAKSATISATTTGTSDELGAPTAGTESRHD